MSSGQLFFLSCKTAARQRPLKSCRSNTSSGKKICSFGTRRGDPRRTGSCLARTQVLHRKNPGTALCSSQFSSKSAESQQQIVNPQLRVLRAMQQEGKPFQDWPAIGQFLDQHILGGDVQLKKEGRTSAKSLLAWGKHQRWQDQSGNIWMLVPTSKDKTDWSESTGRNKVYKDRTLEPLQPRAVQHYAALITANSTQDVREALSSLGLYDCQSNLFTCWKKTAKALDDWRCVVSGPFVASLWREYSVDGDVPQNKHQLWLCWGCHTASLWGPCEHAYCCMEHEGHSSATSLPKAKPKGRPSRKAKAISTPTVPSQIVPAHSTSEIADTGQGA
jgi:hypothetical protein